MLSRLFKGLVALLLVLFASASADVEAQGDDSYGFLLVRPASVDSPLQPYVIQLTPDSESFGLIFPESVMVTLFAPLNNPLYVQVNPVIPHVMSGGYRLVETTIWNAFTYAIDATNAQDLNDPAFANLVSEGMLDTNFLTGTRPQVVGGESEMLIIRSTRDPIESTGERYEACSINEDVKGVMSIDFAQDSRTNPVFQIVQLGAAPIRIRVPSFTDPIDFIAIGNNFAPAEGNPNITRYTLTGQPLGSSNLLPRDVFAEEQGNASGGPADYSQLYASLERSGSAMFPLFIQYFNYSPATQFIEVAFNNGPACRNLAVGATYVRPIDGTSSDGIQYYPNGRAEALGSIKPGNAPVLITAINPDGRLCFDNPTESGSNVTQVCADGWRLMQVEPPNSSG